MTTSTLNEVSIRVLPFTGKKTEWIAWEAKMLTKAKLKGWKQVMLSKEGVPTETQALTLDDTLLEDILKLKLKKNNDQAYMELLMCMDTSTPSGEVAFDIVNGSKNDDFPDGNAFLAFEALKKKYSPQTAPTLIKLSREFYSGSLSKGSDPDEFISKMERLRQRIKALDKDSMLSDKQFIIVILNNLPSEYENQVNLLERRLDEEPLKLTIEEMRDELNLRYERMNGTNSDGKRENDKAFFAKGKYKGKCNACGKIGHMAKDCWAKNGPPKQNNTYQQASKTQAYRKSDTQAAKKSPFNGNCHFCGIKGHREVDCRKKHNQGKDVGALAIERDSDVALVARDVAMVHIDTICKNPEEIIKTMNKGWVPGNDCWDVEMERDIRWEMLRSPKHRYLDDHRYWEHMNSPLDNFLEKAEGHHEWFAALKRYDIEESDGDEMSSTHMECTHRCKCNRDYESHHSSTSDDTSYEPSETSTVSTETDTNMTDESFVSVREVTSNDNDDTASIVSEEDLVMVTKPVPSEITLEDMVKKTNNNPYSNESTFFDVWPDTCYMAHDQSEDDDDIHQDMEGATTVAEHQGDIDEDAVQMETAGDESSPSDTNASQNKRRSDTRSNLGGGFRFKQYEEDDLDDDDFLSEQQVLQKKELQRLTFNSSVSKMGIWKEAMSIEKKRNMYNNTCTGNTGVNRSDELVQFFHMIGLVWLNMPAGHIEDWANLLKDCLTAVNVTTVKGLMRNIIRVPSIVPGPSRVRFTPHVMDSIAYCGVDWMEMLDKVEAFEDVNVKRNPIRQYLPEGTWAYNTYMRQRGVDPTYPWPTVPSPDPNRYRVNLGLLETMATPPRREGPTPTSTVARYFDEENTDIDEDVQKPSTGATPDSAMMACDVARKSRTTKHTWLADSGASCHMTHSSEGMFDCHEDISEISVGNGETMKSRMTGKKMLKILQQDGRTSTIMLRDVKYVPDLTINLLSLTKALHSGYKISNIGVMITLTKKTTKLSFDKLIKTYSGFILGVEMIPLPCPENINHDIAMTAKDMKIKSKYIDINVFHQTLGHPSLETTKLTAEQYGITLTGTYRTCIDCATAKAQQKKTVPSKRMKSTTVAERLSFDISSVQARSVGGAKYWLLIVDEATDYTWSSFLNTKDQLPRYVMNLIRDLKASNRYVRFLRCDNAGENNSLQQQCKEEFPDLIFEYTSPGTPQQNGVVERKFATLYAKARAILNTAQLTAPLRSSLWAEAANAVTDLENYVVTSHDRTSAYMKFYNHNKKDVGALHPFGEVVIVFDHTHRHIRSKLQDRGFPGLYLGKAKDHGHDVYRILRLSTNRVIFTRDIQWMGVFYCQWRGNHNNVVFVEPIHHHDRMDIDAMVDPIRAMVPQPPEQPAPIAVPGTPIPVPTRVASELRRLASHNNDPLVETQPAAPIPVSNFGMTTRSTASANNNVTFNDIVQVDRGDMGAAIEPLNDIAQIMADMSMSDAPQIHADTRDKDIDENIDISMYKDKIELPKNFNEAWNHPVLWIRKLWRDAIMKEHKKMEIHKVFKLVNRSSIPNGRRCIKYRWIFEIKRNGTFRARLVACGYSQIAGVDFNDIYSPVVNDIAFRITIVLQLICGYSARVMDIETAFLHGSLEEEIYMEVPDGMKSKEGQVVLLQKSLYGLVQSARQFYKKLIDIMKSVGFKQSEAEPCMLFRKGPKGFVLLVVHVDDCYAIGDDAALDEAVTLIESKGLKIKVETNTQDYLSCEVKFSKDRTGAWIGQPHLMKKIEKSYSSLIKSSSMKYRTPGTPGFGIIRPKEKDEIMPEQDQQTYRSAVGTLLHLIKYSRPDISNPVRELSKCSGVATPEAFKELKRLIKFIVDTKSYGLKMFPSKNDNDEYKMKVYSDSDWAGDKDTRHSVTGFVIFLQDVPIMWKSRSQRSVSLSSSEAEYYAISEAAKDIKFVHQILSSIGIKITLPIDLLVDNIGAIFMSENVSATSRTKHVDIRYHYVREFIESGFIKIQFVPSKDNKSDCFTKNVSCDVYDNHINDFVIKKEEVI